MAGLIHIYCGDGKGKTTAAMGLILRAAGNGKRVLLTQFLKDGKGAELASLRQLEQVEIVPQTKAFGFTWTLTDEQKAEAKAYNTALLENAFARGADFDLLVLDEAVGSVGAGMIEEGRLLELLREKPEELEVVMTGRGPSQALMDAADYVTEMQKIKHPYDNGIPARQGIEY